MMSNNKNSSNGLQPIAILTQSFAKPVNKYNTIDTNVMPQPF